jgi:PAS domain-containing protein
MQMTSEVTTWTRPAARRSGEAVQGQLELLLRHPLLTSMLDGIPDPAMLLNGSRQIVLANVALQQASGCSLEQLRGRRPGEALGCEHASQPPDGCGTTRACRFCGAAHALSTCETTSRAACRECRVRKLGSTESLDLRAWASPMAVPREDFVLLVLQDASAEKRRSALERIFFHDVLNMAGALSGLLELWPEMPAGEASEMVPRLSGLAGQVVEEIQAQRDLMDAERGEIVVQRMALDASEVAAEVVRAYERHPAAEGRRIELRGLAEPRILVSDRLLLRRVLGNLLKNALEGCAPGDTVVLAVEDAGDAAAFHVSNPGVMPEAVKAQVFQRSFSTKAPRNRGLGTYSVKLLAERYLDGSVGFVSEPGRGTVFTVRLPLG